MESNPVTDEAGPDDQKKDGPGRSRATAARRKQNLPSTRAAIDAAIAGFLRDAVDAGVPAGVMFGLRLALEEALSNALHHGNAGDPAKSIRFEYAISPRHVSIEVEDEGEGFDPGTVPDPTQEENLQIPAGRGLILMRAYMKSVEYLGRGNRVRMTWSKAP
jgi:serine/threonine-protein kinase RsbW